jgi:hypothetical protein
MAHKLRAHDDTDSLQARSNVRKGLRRTCCASDGHVLNTDDAPIANANMTGEKSVVFQFGAVRKKNRLILPDVCSDGGLYHDSSIQVG